MRACGVYVLVWGEKSGGNDVGADADKFDEDNNDSANERLVN
jgi:hypothetical protein